MRTPTPEQRSVIENPSRIRLVKAAPGSGKTWLVAEIIRRELEHWDRGRGGIAALSFTRVGGEEIRQAVGCELVHPHFVGTLDAFLFKYVVRPFLQQVRPGTARPRLIPAEWSPEDWRKLPGGVDFSVPNKKAPYNTFKAVFVGESEGGVRIAYPRRYQSDLQNLDETTALRVLGIKEELWNKLGWLTHSDAAFLAALILADDTAGPTVLAEVTRRFPFVIVDELQDTGWFLGRSIRSILAFQGTRGLLVGDPDQAIYEFSGAHPDLFDVYAELPDAAPLFLKTTRRCCPAICRVADELSQSGRTTQPNREQSGRAFLLSYKGFRDAITRLREHLNAEVGTKSIKIIARRHKTITEVTGKPPNTPVPLGSPCLNHMQRAVSLFRERRQAKALAAAKAALELAEFKREGCEDSDLLQRGVDPGQWKRIAVECLLRANEEVAGESLFDWGMRTRDSIHERLKPLADRPECRIEARGVGKPYKKHQGTERSGFLFQPESVARIGPTIPIQTVHAVKGETHDTTVLISPPSRRADRCPSAVWWSDDPADLEERRIAYVAVTRTKGDLIVCVCEESFDRLQQDRAKFVALFECMSVEDFIAGRL